MFRKKHSFPNGWVHWAPTAACELDQIQHLLEEAAP